MRNKKMIRVLSLILLCTVIFIIMAPISAFAAGNDVIKQNIGGVLKIVGMIILVLGIVLLIVAVIMIVRDTINKGKGQSGGTEVKKHLILLIVGILIASGGWANIGHGPLFNSLLHW